MSLVIKKTIVNRKRKKMYPIDKYKFYVNGKNKKVIAVSSYMGKPVRGVAKCNDADTFNLAKGKRLAAARCNLKIALKRQKKVDKEFYEISDYLDAVIELFHEIEDKSMWADDCVEEAYEELNKLIEKY